MRLPEFTKAFFWSYRFEELDTEKDKELIAFQIMNYGNLESWQWLSKTYDSDLLKSTIENKVGSAWAVKSLNFWSKILESQPKKMKRDFIP